MNKVENNIIVSYIIPVYNHAQYLIDVLNSVEKDTLVLGSKCNVIIIDDGSTDNSKDVITNWLSSKSDLCNFEFISRENKGLAATLNELISRSSAKYLRLCSSDDLIVSGSTSLLLKNLNMDTNLIAVSGDGLIINDTGDVKADSSIKFHGGDIKKLINPDTMPTELIFNWCIAGPATLIKREHYNTISYDIDEPIDDFQLFLSLLERSQLKIIQEKVCLYRVHDTNTSKTSVKSKRIINLNSFLNTINSFKYLNIKFPALSALRTLTQAKILFLEGNYIKCSMKIILYAYKRFIVSISKLLFGNK